MKRIPALLVLLALAAPSFADEDAFEFFKEEAQVVTVSRRAEPAWRAPAAVDVVTAEEIKAYGFKEIWDALRYRAGMDVVDGRSLDGNRALVSARGFDSEFVAEMQVLVDGRSVYSPFLGGVYWQSLPVQLQDIERIEIVRGPSAALYGSNAGLGVINIITKKPGSAPAASASAWGGTRGAYDAAASAETGSSAAGLRVSFEDSAGDGHPAADGGHADDFLHLNKLNARGRWSPLAATEVEFLGGGSWMSAGLPGLPQDAESRHVQDFEEAKLARSLGGEDAVEASLSHNGTTIRNGPLTAGDVTARTYQYDADLLHRFVWLDGLLNSSWGADWRESGAYSDQTFVSPAQSNRLVRGFTHHAARLSERVTAVGGVSLEHSSTGGTQPAWQAALLGSPADEHALRLSFSQAHTIPPLMQKHADYLLAPGTRYEGNPGFGPETLTSWETGWNGRFRDGTVRSGAAFYYMVVSDLPRLASGGPGIVMSVNGDRAIARGAEASLDWTFAPGRAVFANYAYEVVTHSAPTGVNGFDPSRSTPRHKVNVGARASLPEGFAVSALAGYKDTYAINSDSRGTSAQVAEHFRVDARLAWSPRPGWEMFVAGQDLLQRRFAEYPDGTATPRTFRGGVETRFGP